MSKKVFNTEMPELFGKSESYGPKCSKTILKLKCQKYLINQNLVVLNVPKGNGHT